MKLCHLPSLGMRNIKTVLAVFICVMVFALMGPEFNPLFAAIEHTKVIEKSQDVLIVDMEDGNSFETTGAELYDIIFAENSTIVVSANGTLFDRSQRGVIPAILTRWYEERKKMQQSVIDYKLLGCSSANADENGIHLEPDDLAGLEQALNKLT